MPNDLITLNALACELNDTLSGSRIDKILMPEKDEICLNLRKDESFRLAISCNAQNPRIHLTTIKKENPITAPSFCMHLRKYITGGIINSISLLNDDRIISIEISAKNEMRDNVKYYLVAEMMGRYSNILLLNGNFIISDVLKKAFFDAATKRTVLPSVKYTCPEKSKISLSNANEIATALDNYSGGNLSNYLTSTLSGFSKITAEDIVHFSRVNNECNTLSESDKQSLIDAINKYYTINSSDEFKPCYSVENHDYFIKPYSSQNLNYVHTPTLSHAIEKCIGERDLDERKNDRTKFLYKAYKAFVNKTEKKIEVCYLKLKECANRDKYLHYGEAITSSMYLVKKGMTQVAVPDYRSENQEIITVKLNETLSPQQNAQAYFKKYQKLKRTEDIVNKQLLELQANLMYLKTLEHDISLCSTSAEIAETEKELIEIGALRKKPIDKKNKQKSTMPITYQVDDYLICVGKNNLQNDKLTFKSACGSDIWIHTKNIHGSHTVIFTENRESLPENVLLIACEIAAYYSQGKNDDKVSCDYTLKKFVKRHPCGKAGMVTYTNNKTLVVSPKIHTEYLVN